MCVDHSLPGIDDQGYRSKVRARTRVNAVGMTWIEGINGHRSNNLYIVYILSYMVDMLSSKFLGRIICAWNIGASYCTYVVAWSVCM